DRADRSARSSGRFRRLHCSECPSPAVGTHTRSAFRQALHLQASWNFDLPEPVRSERPQAPGSAPAGSTPTTARPAQVVGCQSLPEAWHRHLANAPVALLPKPSGPTANQPVLPVAVCPRPAFAVANARAPAPLSWEVSCKCFVVAEFARIRIRYS